MNPIIKRMVLGVRKYKNLVTNGNFSNGTTGWFCDAGTTNVESNTCTFTLNGTSIEADMYQNIGPQTIGHKYYMAANMRVRDNVCLRLNVVSNHLVCSILSPVINKWNLLSGIVTYTTNSSYIVLYFLYADDATANGKIVDIQYIKTIDLTATFGAGNEPSLEWCDANIPQNIIW